ncbi:hypothetical protein EDB81DRAFT_55108 [Dactylonectria macrodidyma]|uniref:Uncharacterized protein n=1 Tax=Dactylonectria macrodidyma TaxID=307937 RepID=A0A9P9J1N4_9HYPO|nr:hypothetical protein EDB81DRAFT_55108 [Dactylonectria macrodidyma]
MPYTNSKDKHGHRRPGPPKVGIPMTRRYTQSKIPRTGHHKCEVSDFIEKDEEIFPHFCMICEKEFVPHYASVTPFAVHLQRMYLSSRHQASPRRVIDRRYHLDLEPLTPLLYS